MRPGEGVEMKYHMQKGAVMVYGWKADGKLAFEFHGEPDQKPNKDYFESYQLDDKVGKDSNPTALLPRPPPAFTAGSGRTRAIKTSCSI